MTAGAFAAATCGAVGVSLSAIIASDRGRCRGDVRQFGSGGKPTRNAVLARLAREHGHGEPLMFVDLAAVEQNAKVVVEFARAQRWAVRPALKVFQCPKLCAYIMSLCDEPRGLVFHLRTVHQIMTAAPAGTDLMMGYPPTPGSCAHTSAPPRLRVSGPTR